MKIAYFLCLSLASIFNSINLSSQSDPSRKSDLNPGTSRSRPSSSRRSPDTTLSLANPHFSFTSSDVAGPSSRPDVSRSSFPNRSSSRRSPNTNLSLDVPESAARSRSRSPTVKDPSSSIFGYPIKEYKFLELTSYENPDWCFQIRMFKFPSDKQLRFLKRPNVYEPVYDTKFFVLSTLEGEVFGVLRSTEEGMIALKLYVPTPRGHEPVKVDMQSGDVVPLTRAEIENCQLDDKTPLLYTFEVAHTQRLNCLYFPHLPRYLEIPKSKPRRPRNH